MNSRSKYFPVFNFEELERRENEQEEKECKPLSIRPDDLGIQNLTLETDDENFSQEKPVFQTGAEDLPEEEVVVETESSNKLRLNKSAKSNRYRPQMTLQQMKSWFTYPISLIIARIIPVIMVRTVHLMITMAKKECDS